MLTRSRGSVPVNYVPLKQEPGFATTDGGGGDGGGTGNACNIGIDSNGCCDYVTSKEEPEFKFVDVYYHPLKEEPKPELGSGDGDAVDVNGYYDHDPLKVEPELVATDDDIDTDSGPDVSYDCSHCGISLSSRKFKVAHELRCKVRRQQRELESQVTNLYHCRYCRCPFLSEEYKEQHQRRWCRKRPVAKRRESNGPYFACDKCKYVAKWKQSLESHVLTHNKDNAEWFTCTQCSFKTVHKRNMTDHTKIHGNIFSCCCPICGKSFRTKAYLDNHLLKQHSDESDEVAKLISRKIYTCDICDKYRTTKKTEFNEHLTVTHNKDVGCQKYECPRCPYSTFNKANLNRHSKTHTEQKDYRCSVCKKLFSQKRGLDSHILYIHADKVDLVKTITSKIHCCELCSFKTIYKIKLEIHVQSKHI